MSTQHVSRRTNRFLSGSLVFLTISVIGSGVFFWRPWTGDEMNPGSVESLVLTGFLIMIMIGLGAMAVGLIRYVDGQRRVRQQS